MKIILQYHDQAALSAISNALISFDIIADGCIELAIALEHKTLSLQVENDDGGAVVRKSYSAPMRLGRILDDAAMVLSGARAAPRLTLGGYILDVAQNTLYAGDEAIRLTDREADILVYLHNAHPKTVERQELLQEIWQYVEGVETHTLETHIYRLRQKIAAQDGDELLLTDENGYRLSF